MMVAAGTIAAKLACDEEETLATDVRSPVKKNTQKYACKIQQRKDYYQNSKFTRKAKQLTQS